MNENILEKENKSNDLITISDLLSENHYYRIPDYQRGYSWNSDKELFELWKDIMRLYHTNNANIAMALDQQERLPKMNIGHQNKYMKDLKNY